MDKIEAESRLGNCFIMRNTLNDEKLEDRLIGGNKGKIEAAVQETLDWLRQKSTGRAGHHWG